MAQRTAFLNSDAKWFNKDFHHTWISNYMLKQPWVMFSNYTTKPEFALGNWQISWGKAIIRCTRTTGTFAGEEILACFESTATENISTSGNKKIYIEIPEVYVNDSTAITDALTQWANLNVWRIVSSDSYPTHSNYIKLWEVTGWDWQNATDLRPEVLRRGKPNSISYFGWNWEEERIDIDNNSLNKYLMSNWAWVAPSWEEWGGGGWGWSWENFKRTFTADEDLVAKSMFWVAKLPWVDAVDSSIDIWKYSWQIQNAFNAILNGEDFDSLTLKMSAVNSPADTITVRIETVDSDWYPTWNLIDVWAYWTATPTSDLDSVTFNLAWTITGLTAHTKVAVVIQRNWTISNSNYFTLWVCGADKQSYDITKMKVSNNWTWWMLWSSCWCVDCDWFMDEAVIKSTASVYSPKRLWYCETWATAWNNFTGILKWTVDYEWATIWTKYYIKATGDWTLVTYETSALVWVWVADWILQIWDVTVNSSWYDAIVDASGNWDFYTITEALATWKENIFVRNWTYNEWVQLLIESPVVIQWESSDWVIVNLEKSSTETTYLWFLNFNTSDYSWEVMCKISNITFNAIVWKGNQTYYFSLVETPWVSANKNITINNCYINLLWKVLGCNASLAQLTESDESCTTTLTYNNCIITISAHPSISATDCSWRVHTWWESEIQRMSRTISNGCKIIMNKTSYMRLYIRWTNNNCNYWIKWDSSTPKVYMSINWYNEWCFFDFSWYGYRAISWILVGCTLGNYWSFKPNGTDDTAVQSWLTWWAAEWQSSHSYSEGDVVRDGWDIWICREAHTSSTSIDENKFETYVPYTKIFKEARITDSYLWLSNYTVMADSQSTHPWIWGDEMGLVSNNELTTSNWTIVILWRKIMTWNTISSTVYNRTYDLYAMDNCIINSNFFNFWTAWKVSWIWENTIISWNVLNAYSWTPTCTVVQWSNNIADNNIISTKQF